MRYGRSFQQQRLTVHFVHRFVDHEMLAAAAIPGRSSSTPSR